MPWCCPAPLVCGDQSDEAEHGSGIGLKLLGFIGNRCSYSSRIAVRNHPGFGVRYRPGIAFTSSKNPQLLLFRLNGR
jgi:hypothetical protein